MNDNEFEPSKEILAAYDGTAQSAVAIAASLQI
jgi:hypothetical protein